MGFFDRFTERKGPPAAARSADTKPTDHVVAASAGGVRPQLVAARECLDAKDLPAALALYEEILTVAGDRADVLVTISGDLGVTGYLREIIELVAPRYAADRHGPAVGLNLVQAYLALRDPEAAQHMLDILFTLNRPELEDRLHGFSNAIAELLAQDHTPQRDETSASAPGSTPETATKVDVISFSKPIWFYGLEPLAEKILPEKSGRLRRLAFAQLSVLSTTDMAAPTTQLESELGRLSRTLPLWLAETFYFSQHYSPISTAGVMGHRSYAIFSTEWTTDHLRQLVESTEGGLDFIFTGALRQVGETRELLLRLWDVKKYRERKQFSARWTPETADAELARLHEQIRLFMEWSPVKSGLTYAPPAHPRAWLDTLGISMSLFLAEKDLMSRDHLAALDDLLVPLAAHAASGEVASLAYLTARNRAERLQLASRLDTVLASSPLIAQASVLPA